MSSKSLSAVLEKQIRRLCLKDFPCGIGSWRRTKDSPEGAEAESGDALLDLLDCPRSPWRLDDESWSPQASALRRLAVTEPQRLNADFIYSYFMTLRILGKDVSTIDDGLLKFSKLEELVLSANVISEIPAENLSSTLKILELRENRLSSLSGLTRRPPPQLQYLGLGSNSLGSHQDIFHLTGRHWPQLVCLDLSDCEFQNQQVLLSALSSLPSLKTLMLEGNPFTLAASYPGFTVDSLPQLVCLDATWISAEERRRFRGLATMSGLNVDLASVTVNLDRWRGIPDAPKGLDKKAPDFPLVTCRYFITYQFLSSSPPHDMNADSESEPDAASTAPVTEDSSSVSDQQTNQNCDGRTSRSDAGALSPDGTCFCGKHCQKTSISGLKAVSQHSTSKLTRSEIMDFSDTQTHVVSSLIDLKKFLNRGLYLRLEEEKILSRPAASEDVAAVKPEKGKKSRKEEEVPVKSSPIKDKKRKSVPELVQDAPIRRILASTHVPLQTLVHGTQKVSVLCDFGPLQAEQEDEATQVLLKELKEEKDKESKQREGGSTKLKNTAPLKGKETKNRAEDVHLEPVTVELCVELEKWQSASEAHCLTHTKTHEV